jgi:hypothetical protein
MVCLSLCDWSAVSFSPAQEKSPVDRSPPAVGFCRSARVATKGFKKVLGLAADGSAEDFFSTELEDRSPHGSQRTGLCAGGEIVFRLPITAAQFIN